MQTSLSIMIMFLYLPIHVAMHAIHSSSFYTLYTNKSLTILHINQTLMPYGHKEKKGGDSPVAKCQTNLWSDSMLIDLITLIQYA